MKVSLRTPGPLLAALLLCFTLGGASPAAPASFTVTGTAGDDEIVLDAVAGEARVNDVTAFTFTPGSHRFTIVAGEGKDSVTIIDGPGNSRYAVNFGPNGRDNLSIEDGSGNDRYAVDGTLAQLGLKIQVADGPGNDRYSVLAGDGGSEYHLVDNTGSGNDRYTLNLGAGQDQGDLADGPGNDRYTLNTGGGPDALLNLVDWTGSGKDRYALNMGEGEDVVEILDGEGAVNYQVDMGPGDDLILVNDSSGKDHYTIRGGGNTTLSPGDKIVLSDPFVDPDKGKISGFETTEGALQ